MDKMTKRYLKEQKKNMSLLGMKYIDESDKRNIDFICNELLHFDTGAIVSSKKYSFDVVKRVCLDVLKMFDSSIADVAHSSLYFVNIERCVDRSHEYLSRINFDSNTIYNNKNDCFGTVCSATIPCELEDKDFIYMGHELLHFQKDVSISEHQIALTLGDVIPLFYEMFATEKLYKVARSFWKSRLDLLKANIDLYIQSSNEMNRIVNRDLYKVSQTISGQYLNSFYYALVLYNLYKEKTLEVLDLVKSVIACKMTTLDLLVKLDIYKADNDSVVLEHLNRIKMILK